MNVFFPCLLERWSSPAKPGGSVRSASSWADVRRDVMRNLEWLLNTEQPALLADIVPPEAVQRSVLCFGIPAYSGKVQSAFNAEDVAWSIRERILAFEPRIEAATLSVDALGAEEGHPFNRLRFSIHGYLRADPLPIEFLVQSELDMESGSATIKG